MIQTEISDGRGGMRKLEPHEPEYWEGAYRYEPYPKALYRQTQPGQAAEFREVKNQSAHEALGSDWHESPADAARAFASLEADIAKAAAERLASDQRMSANAQAEALARDRATDTMQPEIPATPIKKRGRKPKAPTISET